MNVHCPVRGEPNGTFKRTGRNHGLRKELYTTPRLKDSPIFVFSPPGPGNYWSIISDRMKTDFGRSSDRLAQSWPTYHRVFAADVKTTTCKCRDPPPHSPGRSLLIILSNIRVGFNWLGWADFTATSGRCARRYD